MGGLNRVRFRGRVHGRPLAPGRYVIDVVVVRGRSPKRIGRVTVEIVSPGRRLTRAQRVAPLEAACAAPAGSAPLPGAIVEPRSGQGGSGAGPGAGHPSKAGGIFRGGVLSAVFRAPKLPGLGGGDGDGGGGLAWFGYGVYLVLFAAFLTMLVYVARFLRGSWNP